MSEESFVLPPANRHFFVGGLPRGGTTAFARALHASPGIFCYAPESHILPLLFELAEIGPIPKLKRSKSCQFFKQQCHDVLIDMMAYSIERGADPKWQIFNKEKIEQLANHVSNLIAKDYFGTHLLSEAMGYFFALTEQNEEISLFGEKTPPNTFVHDHYGDKFPAKFFHVMREPFSSCLSSHKRASNPDDKYAGVFSTDLVENVGLYLHYMHAMERLKSKKNAFLVRYEDLLSEKEATITKALTFLNSNNLPTYDEKHYRFLRPQERENAFEDIDKQESAMIYLLTKRACRRSGYDAEFLNNLVGYDLEAEANKLTQPINHLYKLYGVRENKTGTLTCDRRFAFALPTPQKRKKIRIQISLKTPKESPEKHTRLALFANDSLVLRHVEISREINYELILNDENLPEDAFNAGFFQIRGESNCGFRDIQLTGMGMSREEKGLTLSSSDFC